MKKFTRASLVADALCLGPHWIYNQSKIAREYPDGVYKFTDPTSSYHSGKSAGNFTHYGDQTILLADLLEIEGSYELESWRKAWLAGMDKFSGYLDGASKETLVNIGARPSGSNDLAGAARIGPILDLNLNLDEAVVAARSQTALTHGDPDVVDAADFFTRAAYALEGGASMASALERAANEGEYTSLQAAEHLAAANAADAENFLKVATKMGMTCHCPEAFPLSLYFALHHGENFAECMSQNALAGGDSSARAMLLALLFAARDGDVGADLSDGFQLEKTEKVQLGAGRHSVSIEATNGSLSGVLELPKGEVKAYVMFAHCFTCGKDFLPGTRISKALAAHNMAVLRVDFSGVGNSDGEFAASSFLTNLEDLVAASAWLEKNYEAPQMIVGHSLGGAAALAAAGMIESIKAVATIGAPSDPGHVTHMFEQHLEEIESKGSAEVTLAGRPFTIGKKFLEDLCAYDHKSELKALQGINKLIMHSTQDTVVPLENAGRIYSALTHPKSFIALPDADHLLLDSKDSQYVADLIEVWARRALQ